MGIQHGEQLATRARENRQEADDSGNDVEDLNGMLQELRILLQGVQVLSAFLIILPFSQGFAKIDQVEKWVYVATFACALSSLILMSAPAAQHRLERPLMDRVRFKQLATRMIIIGLAPFSLALILTSHLVVSEVVGSTAALIVSGLVAVLLAVLWWVLPIFHKQRDQTPK